MVTESGMSACVDFTQNAWRKELCANCQRPRGEHPKSGKSQDAVASEPGGESPKPAKRNSVMTKSMTSSVVADEDEEDKWNSFCIPTTDGHTLMSEVLELSRHAFSGPDNTTVNKARPESPKTSVKAEKDSKANAKPANTDTNNMTRDSRSRSRSRSRDQSPILPVKPRIMEDMKTKKTDSGKASSGEKAAKASSKLESEVTVVAKNSGSKVSHADKDKGQGKSAISGKREKKKNLSVKFTSSDVTVIGTDGGYDNLFPEDENVVSDDPEQEVREIMIFTESEKEFLMLALKNTIWNSDSRNLKDDSAKLKSSTQSKTFEDLEVESLLKPDRFAQVRDCDAFPDPQVYGTFPLRSKTGKAAFDNLFTDGSRLSVLSESLENTILSDPQGKDKDVLVFKKETLGGSTAVDLQGERNCSEDSEPNYDDPWGDKFGFDSESEMNLLDEIRGEIDLDSSSAGMALVDLLNDVLAKYSTGSPSETDSIKNFEGTFDDEKSDLKDGVQSDLKSSKEKPSDLEVKMVTLAASLRKQRAKRHAPRPPSCPPPPEPVMTPAKQLELRAAQSKEPTFKMVPIGKPIGGGPPSDKSVNSSPKKSEPSTSVENTEAFRLKGEKEKPKRGFTSFFRNFLRRGRDSESDLTNSSEALSSEVSSDSETSDKGGSLEKRNDKVSQSSDKRTSKSSPKMKLKVLPPARPVSPKPVLEKSLSSPGKSVSNAASSDAKPDTNITGQADVGKSEMPTQEKDKSAPVSSPTPKSKDAVQTKSPVNVSPEKVKETATTAAVVSKAATLPASNKPKEAPPVPPVPPGGVKDKHDFVPPKPRARGNSDGGPPKPRKRENSDLTAPPRPIHTPNVPPPKPPIAAKPRPSAQSTESLDSSGKLSPPLKERLPSTSSLDDELERTGLDSQQKRNGGRRSSRDQQKKVDPSLMRKRAKSPKRFPAPAAPNRGSSTSVISDSNVSLASTSSEVSSKSVAAKSGDQKSMSFAKELELKLTKAEPLPQADGKKMAAPPPPVDPVAKATPPKDETAVKHTAAADEKQTAETEKQDTSPPLTAPAPSRPVEKIELPKQAGSSRKSFLGKLNRKNRPPPPPSVKRTKSITESTVLGGEHLSTKKIDLKDISGPVLITEMSSNKVVNRRNTITLGEDSAFLSGGSTSSGSTGEKSEMSPRGSLENLYELITPEAPAPPVDKRNFYDPVDPSKSLRPPSLGIEGYLEPVRSHVAALAAGEPVIPSTMSESMPNMKPAIDTVQSTVTAQDGVQEITMTAVKGEVQDIDEERRLLLASQPIYEEITGYGRLEPNIKYSGSTTPAVAVAAVEMIPTEDEEAEEEEEEEDEEEVVPVKPQSSASGLKSKDSFSSESDFSSASNSLSRPRPVPRKRPRQSQGSGFEQYVAMNRPSVAVFLNEGHLREMLSQLTAMNLHTLRDIYTQHEKAFMKESLQLGGAGPLKWHDFDIYGKPVHTSERCIVYNAKLKPSLATCQVMLLHSRPEITPVNHPSLLKPTCIFTDTIPFSYLAEDFIRTSQLLQNCTQANTAKCYVCVGLFDITENLTNHIAAMETCDNQKEFLRKVLFIILQLLSAISHCLELSHPLAEADFHDIYLISNPYCLGETVSFLPQQRSPDSKQMEAVCLFLDKFLQDMCARCEATSVLDDSAFVVFNGIQKIISMLEPGNMDCIAVIRSFTEFILWGPAENDLPLGDDRESNLEPKLSMWLERKRAELIHDFARRVQHGARCVIQDFYCMKFLLKASSGSLSECIRCQAS